MNSCILATFWRITFRFTIDESLLITNDGCKSGVCRRSNFNVVMNHGSRPFKCFDRIDTSWYWAKFSTAKHKYCYHLHDGSGKLWFVKLRPYVLKHPKLFDGTIKMMKRYLQNIINNTTIKRNKYNPATRTRNKLPANFVFVGLQCIFILYSLPRSHKLSLNFFFFFFRLFGEFSLFR